jgi:hypothetical protein
VSVTISKVFLRDGASGKLVAADLYDAISSKHLDDYETYWKPVIALESTEHNHWDWRQKMEEYSTLSYESFAIEYSGMTQGMMIVNTIKRCRLPIQANKHLAPCIY